MIDWEFWVAAGGMTAVVTALLLLTLRGTRRAEPAADYDLQVYRDQLGEVDRDLARGTIGPEEAGRLRTEVARRVLDADRALAGATPVAGAPRAATWVAALAMVTVGVSALWLYDRIGAPGYPDLPNTERFAEAQRMRDARPSQASVEAKIPPAPAAQVEPGLLDLMTKLRAAVAARPDDLRGEQLLAQNEARLGNYPAAWKAQAQVIRIEGAKATAADYVSQAGLMILATNGYVSPEADQPLAKALQLDPRNGTARYYTGLMFAQTGRPDVAFQFWAPLLNEGPETAPWIAPVRAQIGEVAQLAGINYTPPPVPGAPGPSAGDMQAAAQMTPEARQQMIRGMVEQLATRLDAQGGSADEWVRLIRAYGVLGEADKQKAALATARKAFADKPDELAKVQAAAEAPAPGAAMGGDGTAGPTAGDMQAAGQMAPADRQTMIQGMVSKLADQLQSQGGTPAQWAQLITAYGVLGQADKARDIWTKAQGVFAGHDADLATVRAAAEKAGVGG
jgi:cytochrome c-type biogenesis protein CcmH